MHVNRGQILAIIVSDNTTRKGEIKEHCRTAKRVIKNSQKSPEFPKTSSKNTFESEIKFKKIQKFNV